MLSATKTTKANQRWTLKSRATPEIIDEYVSGARFGDNDEYVQAARDAASEYLKRQVRAVNDGRGQECTVSDIDGQHVIYVDGFEAGVTWALRKVRDASKNSARRAGGS
jgi:hypothetical protein